MVWCGCCVWVWHVAFWVLVSFVFIWMHAFSELHHTSCALAGADDCFVYLDTWRHSQLLFAKKGSDDASRLRMRMWWTFKVGTIGQRVNVWQTFGNRCGVFWPNIHSDSQMFVASTKYRSIECSRIVRITFATGCGQRHVGNYTHDRRLIFGELGVTHPSCGRLRSFHGRDRDHELPHRDDLVRRHLFNDNPGYRCMCGCLGFVSSLLCKPFSSPPRLTLELC